MKSINNNITPRHTKHLAAHSLKAAALLLLLSIGSHATRAAIVDFTFTGAGINGSVATGAFSVDDGYLDPIYFGQIFPDTALYNFTLTISNIPDGGGASYPFGPTGERIYFGVDNAGIARIIPSASYGFPSNNASYGLTANADFYAPPFTPYYHSVLNLFTAPFPSPAQKDDITWAPAVRVVPEPTSAALLGLGVAIVASRFLRQRPLRTQK